MEKIPTPHIKLTVKQLRDALQEVPDDYEVRLNVYTNKVYGENIIVVPNRWDYAGRVREDSKVFELKGTFENEKVQVRRLK